MSRRRAILTYEPATLLPSNTPPTLRQVRKGVRGRR
jgi:hypothetical protein